MLTSRCSVLHLYGANAAAQVDVEDDGEQQRIHVRVQYPGRLLLHWGVEGGAGYEGGWRLPGGGAQPPNTVSYKNRALQTPLE